MLYHKESDYDVSMFILKNQTVLNIFQVRRCTLSIETSDFKITVRHSPDTWISALFSTRPSTLTAMQVYMPLSPARVLLISRPLLEKL